MNESEKKVERPLYKYKKSAILYECLETVRLKV